MLSRVLGPLIKRLIVEESIALQDDGIWAYGSRTARHASLNPGLSPSVLQSIGIGL